MKWFKKKHPEKHSKEVKTEILTLQVSTLIRNLLYDSLLENPESISHRLGLPPISEEVSEMEQEASTARIKRIEVLLPFITAHADMYSEISFAKYCSVMSLDDMSESAQETVSSLFKLISFASATSCLSTLVDLGLVEVPVLELDIYGK
jgi:hypothetical protein